MIYNHWRRTPFGRTGNCPLTFCQVFGPNGQAILIAYHVLLLQNENNAFALHSNKPNLLSPDAFYDQKMHRNAFAKGAASPLPTR